MKKILTLFQAKQPKQSAWLRGLQKAEMEVEIAREKSKGNEKDFESRVKKIIKQRHLGIVSMKDFNYGYDAYLNEFFSSWVKQDDYCYIP